MTPHLSATLALPEWITRAVEANARYEGDDAKLALAIELSRLNVEHATGGPFGAAVFQGDALIGVGVNRVVPQNSSIAHAEMMAYLTTQAATGRNRLNEGHPGITLATSSQPCCQCYGATFWAGIDTLLIGASASDVMELTAFDEGPLPADWRGELIQRGIAVREGIGRDAARAVLADYARRGGENY